VVAVADRHGQRTLERAAIAYVRIEIAIAVLVAATQPLRRSPSGMREDIATVSLPLVKTGASASQLSSYTNSTHAAAPISDCSARQIATPVSFAVPGSASAWPNR
jgi:hypothetical protein